MQDVTLRVGGRLLLDGASLRLPRGHRVGLVGRNGSGKTSLLRLIQGENQPDAGSIKLRKGARIGWVAQEAPGGEATPREVVLAADRERTRLLESAEKATEPGEIAEIQTRLADIGAHAAPSRAAVILSGLGFDEHAQNRRLSSFSGGWRMRVALASVLFAEPDLLLLDEPTNHLDLEASLWLEDYLRRYQHTLLLVSHDRNLLNRVPERIVHLEACKLTTYTGAYDAFEKARSERLVLQAKERDRIEAKRKHMQAFVDRFRYKASKARQAQSRLKALAKLSPLPSVTEAPDVVLRFPATKVPAPPLITLDRVKAGYGDHVVLDRLDLRIDPDDRIALLGANGNGKSTLARLLAGSLAPLDGEVVSAAKLRVGFFAQHQIEELVPGETALQHLARRLPREREERLRTHLGGFGLSQDKADLPAARLSGGEKARLTFALMSAQAPQVLILDEPTNHLDVDSRDALIEAVNGFPGAVILISHDRHLIELTADRLWLVADGQVRPFDGDVDQYRRSLVAPELRFGGGGNGEGRRKERRRGAEQRQRLTPLRQAAREAERTFERLSMEHQDLAAKLADAATYDLPGSELESMVKREADLKAQIDAAEARWLEAEQSLEQAQS